MLAPTASFNGEPQAKPFGAQGTRDAFGCPANDEPHWHVNP
jgi:hypothetical protein